MEIQVRRCAGARSLQVGNCFLLKTSIYNNKLRSVTIFSKPNSRKSSLRLTQTGRPRRYWRDVRGTPLDGGWQNPGCYPRRCRRLRLRLHASLRRWQWPNPPFPFRPSWICRTALSIYSSGSPFRTKACFPPPNATATLRYSRMRRSRRCSRRSKDHVG
jgi:hypothetical protein